MSIVGNVFGLKNVVMKHMNRQMVNYIGDSYDRSDNIGDFKKMYGKDAEFIDVTSVTSVTKTMNKKFLEKN